MPVAGILTGGGDAPGLNGVIRGAVHRLARAGWEVHGYLEGWQGVLADRWVALTPEATRHIIAQGGTLLGSSRTNPYKQPGDLARVRIAFEALDALIAVGGDDTLGVAARLWKEEKLPVVGVPKTIDNDLNQTDYTFGFDTAVNIAAEAMDRLWTTANSHRRVLVVECMGRKAGWITAYAGMAAGADAILVPEQPVDLDDLCARLRRTREVGQEGNLVAVSEGATLKPGDYEVQDATTDDFGNIRLGGVAKTLAQLIEERTGLESRAVVLGHLQRGGTPTAHDRVLATRYGVAAAEAVLHGSFGRMVALQGDAVVEADIGPAVAKLKLLPDERYRLAELFFAP